jgi:hypothetical protein
VCSALQSFVKRRTKDIPAVDRISFSLVLGEILGFIGLTAWAKLPQSYIGPPKLHQVQFIKLSKYLKQEDHIPEILLDF